jgi:hypothetical protein
MVEILISETLAQVLPVLDACCVGALNVRLVACSTYHNPAPGRSTLFPGLQNLAQSYVSV